MAAWGLLKILFVWTLEEVYTASGRYLNCIDKFADVTGKRPKENWFASGYELPMIFTFYNGIIDFTWYSSWSAGRFFWPYQYVKPSGPFLLTTCWRNWFITGRWRKVKKRGCIRKEAMFATPKLAHLDRRVLCSGRNKARESCQKAYPVARGSWEWWQIPSSVPPSDKLRRDDEEDGDSIENLVSVNQRGKDQMSTINAPR